MSEPSHKIEAEREALADARVLGVVVLLLVGVLLGAVAGLLAWWLL